MSEELLRLADEEIGILKDRLALTRQQRDEALAELKAWEDRDDTALRERDEAQGLVMEAARFLGKWDRNSWNGDDLDQLGDFLVKLRKLPWFKEPAG